MATIPIDDLRHFHKLNFQNQNTTGYFSSLFRNIAFIIKESMCESVQHVFHLTNFCEPLRNHSPRKITDCYRLLSLLCNAITLLTYIYRISRKVCVYYWASLKHAKSLSKFNPFVPINHFIHSYETLGSLSIRVLLLLFLAWIQIVLPKSPMRIHELLF